MILPCVLGLNKATLGIGIFAVFLGVTLVSCLTGLRPGFCVAGLALIWVWFGTREGGYGVIWVSGLGSKG